MEPMDYFVLYSILASTVYCLLFAAEYLEVEVKAAAQDSKIAEKREPFAPPLKRITIRIFSKREPRERLLELYCAGSRASPAALPESR
jgi:hypothetical protein